MSLSWDIHIFDQVISTQDIARDSLRRGAGAGYCARAIEQSGGRGRHGRSWIGLPGNLFFSFIVEPARSMAEWGSLSLLAGLTLVEAVGHGDAVMKWPNDVMIDGNKVAGILVEIEGDAAIIGIGVNVAGAPENVGGVVDGVAVDIFDRFLGVFMARYEDWERGGFATIKTDWLARSYDIGTGMSVKLPAEIVAGGFVGVSDQGALLLEMENGSIRTITTGEITDVTSR